MHAGSRRFAWKSGLDRPPPDKILVGYDSGRVDDFIEIADVIEDAFPQLMVEGVETEDGEGMSSSSLRITLEDGTLVISDQSVDEVKAHVVQRLEDMGLIHS